MSDGLFQIVQRMSVGGLETLAADLASGLSGDQRVVSLEGDGATLARDWARAAALGRNLVALNKRDGMDIGALFRLARLFVLERPKAVVTHHIGPMIYGGVAARLAGVRRLVHVEHDAWHYSSAKRRALARMIAALTQPTIVAVSPRVANGIADVYPGRRITCVTNGVDVSAYSSTREAARRLLQFPDDKLLIGAAGRLEHVKGHDVLIEALSRLPGNVTLAIAGDGSRQTELETLAARLGVADRIRFLGRRDDLPSIYPAFDAFVLPSRAEGLPLALLEAQAAGVPAVATNVGDVARALCPHASRLVPPEDPSALAAAIRDVLEATENPSPRGFVERNFAWKDTLSAYARLTGASQC